ncbi:AMP-binding protein [Corynebacterium macginleyi]|nr:AMP-binding protein [Corynebacterium macginleyi]
MSAYESRAWIKHYSDWTPATLDYGDKTIVDYYVNNLRINANKSATYFFGNTQNYAELDAQVRAAAAGLKAFGIRPGDRVAIVMPNCPQHVVAFYAIQLLGATAVEHNPLYTAHELEGLFQDHGARVVIAWDKTAPTLEKIRATTPLETIVSVNMIDAMPPLKRLALRIPLPPLAAKREQLTGAAPNTVAWSTLIGSAIGGDGKDLEIAQVTQKDIALILYTSGTTGKPKGALLSHGNLIANCVQGEAWLTNMDAGEQRFLAALPLFHAYGMTTLCVLSIYFGAELILVPSPHMPLIIDTIKKHTPTWLPGVPTLYEKIMDAAEEKGVDLAGISNAFSGAATLPADVMERWEFMTGGRLVEGFGMTETSPVLVGNPMNGNRRPGYIGLPFPDVEVRIGNPDNLDETQPDGEPGEMLARGPQVFQGYFNNEKATEECFHNGWFRTGDMAIMDEDGWVRLVSRIKEIIITGGFNVYPAEVEEVVRKHPDVKEVAVVGRPRKDGSEDVVACVVLRDGAVLDPDGLKSFCRQRLTRYKVPRTFYHFKELASDQLGKVRRRMVQEDLLDLIKQKA